MPQGMLGFKWTEEVMTSHSYFHSVSLWKYEVLNMTLTEGGY